MRAWCLLLAACAGAPDVAEDPCEGGGEALYVVRSLYFQRPEEGVDGVCDGFDLDGIDTPDGGVEGCGIPDFVGPDGGGGVDNAFAYLLPALEATEAKAVESLVQAAIESGELLITLDQQGVSGPDDACTSLTVGRALGPPLAGAPLIGADGLLLAGQTFAPDPSLPATTVDGVALSDGGFEAPLELSLPLQVFDVALDFSLLEGRVRARLDDDGVLRGLFAGGVDVDYLLSIAAEENVDSALEGILAQLLGTWSDLAPDERGVCTRVSMTFRFEAVPAFWYRSP
ncbi:MAG: hypothetical protein R3F59_32400 [Myxococcota bacterium]